MVAKESSEDHKIIEFTEEHEAFAAASPIAAATGMLWKAFEDPTYEYDGDPIEVADGIFISEEQILAFLEDPGARDLGPFGALSDKQRLELIRMEQIEPIFFDELVPASV